MKENLLRSKEKHKIFLYFLLPKIIVFLQIIKLCSFSCNQKEFPFLKDEICVEYCSIEDINEGICKVENKIIKDQWINNINYISEFDYLYINLVSTANDDLIILMSKYPETNERFFYGITKEGRGYFIIDNKESETFLMTIDNPEIMKRYESEIFTVKLQSKNNTKEYIMDFGKSSFEDTLISIYDIYDKKVIVQSIISVFGEIYNLHQIMGATVNLTDNLYNYYLIGFLGVKYSIYSETRKLYLIKFKLKSLNNDISVDKKIEEVEVYDSTAVSCYETSDYYIICFYKNNINKYTMGVFDNNLMLQTTLPIANGNNNNMIFFKCVHFYGLIGAFIYYKNNDQFYAILEFKKYSENIISDSYSKI